MKFHIHIPKLEEFALYAACLDVVEHGTSGLKKPMPRPLYYRCIMTFAEKTCCHSTSVMKLYQSLRTCSPCPLGYSIASAACITALDHVAIDTAADELTDILSRLLSNEPEDAPAIDCIHRFASRCMAALRYEVMVMVMSSVLKEVKSKAIFEVLVHYGAHLEPEDSDYLEYAAKRGLVDGVIMAISRKRYCVSHRHVVYAGWSGNLEFVKMVAMAVTRCYYNDMNARYLTVPVCDVMLSNNVFQESMYSLIHVESYDVLRWFIKHKLVDLNQTMNNIAMSAATGCANCLELLHYVIERANMKPPSMEFCGHHFHLRGVIPDLSVFDYLIMHGSAMISNAGYSGLPTIWFSRYWADKGMKLKDDEAMHLLDYSIKNANVHAMRVMIKSFDIHIDKLPDYDALLTSACEKSRADILDLLLSHGGDVNVTLPSRHDFDRFTLLHNICKAPDRSVMSMLIQHGANVNAVNGYGDTPLHLACKHGCCVMVDMLITANANVNTVNAMFQTPLHNACIYGWTDIVYTLVQHGADVDMHDEDGNTALSLARTHGWGDIVQYLSQSKL